MGHTLKITKLGSNKFEHIHNGISANAFFISDFSATLDGDKFNIVQNDGAVRFTYKVADITFLDQTTGGSDETFVSPFLLWNRLISVQYTPFFTVPAGLSLDEYDAIHGANNPSASNVFATMADVGGGGGGVGTLQQVVDNSGDLDDGTGNTAQLQASYLTFSNSSNNGGIDANGGSTTNSGSNKSVGYRSDTFIGFYWDKVVSSVLKTITILADNVVNNCNFQLPNKADGTYTIATTNDIPDISGKEDSSNKVTTFTGNTTSTTKFPVVKATVDYINSLGFITNVITALGYTPANKAGETFTGSITATNLSGTNTGDETTATIKSKLGITILSGSNTGDETNSTIISKIGYTPENSANKGANNGYAGLDSTGKVPSSQLPSYVDDVLEFANLASFPSTGESGKIYIALDTNLEYRWSGSTYINIAKGEVQSVNTKTGAVVLNTDDIAESGTPTNKWWTNARTIASTLTGFNSGSGTVTSSDSVLTALQKLAGNISTLVTGVSSVNTKTGAVTLTTADIADSTNKRYQTDNQNTYNDATSSIQTQLNNKQDILTSTNFGTFSNGLTAKTTPVDADTLNLSDSADSNKSKKLSLANLKATLKSYFDGLYSPLYYNYKNTTPSSTVTGTLTEAQLIRIQIDPNTFGANDFLKIPSLTLVKSGTNSTITIRVKLSTSSTMPSSSTGQIALLNITSTSLFSRIQRTFSIASGNIIGFNNNVSSNTDLSSNTNTISSQAFDRTVTQYLYVSATLGNASDSVYLNDIQVTNV